jgi:hypothetical protein
MATIRIEPIEGSKADEVWSFSTIDQTSAAGSADYGCPRARDGPVRLAARNLAKISWALVTRDCPQGRAPADIKVPTLRLNGADPETLCESRS